MRGWRLIFLLLFVGVTAAGVYVWRAYKRPLDMPADRVEVRIAARSSARSIARQLQQAGVKLDVVGELCVQERSRVRPAHGDHTQFFEGRNRPAVDRSAHGARLGKPGTCARLERDSVDH